VTGVPLFTTTTLPFFTCMQALQRVGAYFP
jgi:hypothetical protein